MGHIGKILISALTGTVFMTLYSYRISRKEKKQYREPELLNKLTDRLPEKTNLSGYQPATGFILHYIAGIAFVSSYIPVWRNTAMQADLKSGITLGLLSGLVGAGVWEASFRLHPNPPKVDKTNYYTHLLMAHIIFGAASSLQWRLMEEA